MSAVIGHLARDEKLSPPLTGLSLLIPALLDYRAIPDQYKPMITSYEQNKAAPVLGMPQIERFMCKSPKSSQRLLLCFSHPAQYSISEMSFCCKFTDHVPAGYQPDLKSTLYNVFADPHNFDGLPPTFFQVCGLDPLRDEALLYERLLREQHGTKTLLKVYPGLPHAFWSGFPTLDVSKRFIEETMEGVKWLLEQVGK